MLAEHHSLPRLGATSKESKTNRNRPVAERNRRAANPTHADGERKTQTKRPMTWPPSVQWPLCLVPNYSGEHRINALAPP
jgi:hypothetical protein